jgi:hypothetical protein
VRWLWLVADWTDAAQQSGHDCGAIHTDGHGNVGVAQPIDEFDAHGETMRCGFAVACQGLLRRIQSS